MVYTSPESLHQAKIILAEKGLKVMASELSFRPTVFIPIYDPNMTQKIIQLLTALYELEDVHKVHTNAKFLS